MYSKLYARITESSLMEEPINVRYTFVLMLAIADPEGYVIGTDVAIARRLNMPLDEFEACLRVLMAPDANSNSKDHEGRRVLPSDGERGYLLVNYVNYRDMKNPQARRTYMREYMRRRRAMASESAETSKKPRETPIVSRCKPGLAELGHGNGNGNEEDTEPEGAVPGSGVFSKQDSGEDRKRPSVFKKLTQDHLADPRYLNDWFETISRLTRPVIEFSEVNRLRVFSAAVRALVPGKAKKTPVAYFASIVTGGRWNEITQADEDKAHKLIMSLEGNGHVS